MIILDCVPAFKYPFVIDINDLKRLECTTSACKKENLVGLDQVIEESMKIVTFHFHQESSLDGTYRKPMLLYSRLARGGKTTTLSNLFDEIKNKNMRPMFISFNGSSGFKLIDGETEVEALYRVIVMQLIGMNIYKGGKIFVDWDALDDYIGLEPFILLIDEMNALTFPIGEAVSIVLKKYFLDKSNRYLVITSHMPLDLDHVYSESTVSRRSCEVVELPFSFDLIKLQAMGENCRPLNEKIVAYYGGIPSLMFTERESRDYNPYNRFLDYTWEVGRGENDFLDFITELLNGLSIHESVRVYDKLASLVGSDKFISVLRWPPCYVICILGLFNVSGCGLHYLITSLKALQTYQDALLEGNWWEELVLIGLILRSSIATHQGGAGPLGICDDGEALGASMSLFKFNSDIQTLKKARRLINKQLSENINSVIIFTPSYASFPQFDGFVGLNMKGKQKLIGYQCNHGKAGSKGNKPSWLHKAILLRGITAEESSKLRGWEYWSFSQTKSLLGESFGLYTHLNYISNLIHNLIIVDYFFK